MQHIDLRYNERHRGMFIAGIGVLATFALAFAMFIRVVVFVEPRWTFGEFVGAMLITTGLGLGVGIMSSPIVAHMLAKTDLRKSVPFVYGVPVLLLLAPWLLSDALIMSIILALLAFILTSLLSIVAWRLFPLHADPEVPTVLPCPSCGYDLRGNPHEGCPECGWNRRVGFGESL